MSQHSKAVLVVENGDRTAEFCFRNDLEIRAEGRREFLLGGRGGAINELLSLLDDEDDGDSELNSRESYFLDGGLGTRELTLTATLVGGDTGEVLQMGDGSSTGDEPTEWDATGAENPFSQWAVLDHWLSETKVGSGNPAELHYGEWSDGAYVDEGVYSPREMVVPEWNVEKPRDSPSTVTVTLTLVNAASLADAAEALEDEGR